MQKTVTSRKYDPFGVINLIGVSEEMSNLQIGLILLSEFHQKYAVIWSSSLKIQTHIKHVCVAIKDIFESCTSSLLQKQTHDEEIIDPILRQSWVRLWQHEVMDPYTSDQPDSWIQEGTELQTCYLDMMIIFLKELSTETLKKEMLGSYSEVQHMTKL